MTQTSHRKQIPNYWLYQEPINEVMGSFFNIQKLSDIVATHGPSHHPHRHNDLYQIVWITKGTGQLTVDLETSDYEKGKLFILSPGVVHGCDTSLDIEGFVIHMSNDFIPAGKKEYLLSVSAIDEIEIRPDQWEQMTKVCDQLMNEQLNPENDGHLMIQSYMSILFVLKNRSVRSVSDPIENRLYSDFLSLVEKHYKAHRKTSFYANELNVSPNYLNDCIRTVTGANVSSIIKNRVILEAKRQLIHSNLDVTEIAYSLGFEDKNYFWKYFKQSTKFVPGEFRKAFKLSSTENFQKYQ